MESLGLRGECVLLITQELIDGGMSAEINGEPARFQTSFLAGLRLLTPMGLCLAEVMVTVRDALSTLANQLPDSDASIHLPPVSSNTHNSG